MRLFTTFLLSLVALAAPARAQQVFLLVEDVIQAEDDPNGAISFRVSLSEITVTEVEFDYETIDGSAEAGDDFSGASGTASIPSGSQSVSIDVAVVPDGIPEKDEVFFLRILSPVGAAIGDPQGKAVIVDDDLLAAAPALPPLAVGILIGMMVLTAGMARRARRPLVLESGVPRLSR